jgi:MFS family permease
MRIPLPRAQQGRAGALVATRTFASLRLHRNYRLYFFGQFLSQIGTWLQSAAMAWLVLQLTHSAIAVGLLAFWQFGPYALLGLFGGAISDRLDHRVTLIATQAALALCSGTIAALTLSHVVVVWEVYAIAAMRGLVLVFNNPSRQAFIFQMVGRKELPNAIALNSSLANATRILGPGIGGLLIAAFGVGICFSIDSISYVAVIVALLLMRVDELLPMERGARQSVLRGVGEGLRYVRETPALRLALAMFLFICIASINFSVLLPLVASDTLGVLWRGRADRRAHLRRDWPRDVAHPAGECGRLWAGRGAIGATAHDRGGAPAAGRHRRCLYALHIEHQRAGAARGTCPPARAHRRAV